MQIVTPPRGSYCPQRPPREFNWCCLTYNPTPTVTRHSYNSCLRYQWHSITMTMRDTRSLISSRQQPAFRTLAEYIILYDESCPAEKCCNPRRDFQPIFLIFRRLRPRKIFGMFSRTLPPHLRRNPAAVEGPFPRKAELPPNPET